MDGTPVEDVSLLAAIGCRSLRRNGSFVIVEFHDGTVRLHHLAYPIFHATLQKECEFDFRTEAFLGPAGECIANIIWPTGVPPEAQLLDLMGSLETELKGWKHWPFVSFAYPA